MLLSKNRVRRLTRSLAHSNDPERPRISRTPVDALPQIGCRKRIDMKTGPNNINDGKYFAGTPGSIEKVRN